MMEFFKVAENFIPIELSPLRVPGSGFRVRIAKYEDLSVFWKFLKKLRISNLNRTRHAKPDTRHTKTVLSFLNHPVDSIQQAVLVAILCQLPKHNALEPVIQCIFRFCPDGFNIV